MGFFLTSEQTSQREAQNAQLFSLGIQTGNRQAEESAQRKAAYDQAVATKKIEEDATTQRALVMQERQLARQKANVDMFLAKDASARTKDSVKTGLDSILGLAKKFDTFEDRIISNPAAYGEDAHQELGRVKSDALGILSEAQLAASKVKPGEMFDASPYTNKLSMLSFVPPVTPEYRRLQTEKSETEDAKQFKAYNPASSRVKAKDDVADKTYNKWEAAVGRFASASEAFQSDVARIGEKNYKDIVTGSGNDPLASKRAWVDREQAAAVGFATDIRSEALAGKYGEDIVELVDKFEKEGLAPFDPRDIPRIGMRFGEAASWDARTVSDPTSDKQSRLLTGKPISYWDEQYKKKQARGQFEQNVDAGLKMIGIR
jgi:hypothetical protein